MIHKKSSGMKAAFHIYMVFLLAILVLALSCIGVLMHVVNIQKPDGRRDTGAWPKKFTEQFATHFVARDETISVTSEGIAQLRQYDLWLQVLDEKGEVILSHGTTAKMKTRYSTLDLLHLTGGTQGNGSETTFLGTYQTGEVSGCYLIGFPVNISIVTMYLNGDHFTNGRAIGLFLLIAGFLFVLLAGLAYGLWITRQMRKVTGAVEEIAARTYSPIQPGGFWGDIYRHLNRLDGEIHLSDETKAETDRQREEWISNMTHDIKTPLSPIKGYAELLADAQVDISETEVRTYARTILKNANHVEQLIDDLKLLYQMKGGIMPIHRENTNA